MSCRSRCPVTSWGKNEDADTDFQCGDGPNGASWGLTGGGGLSAGLCRERVELNRARYKYSVRFQTQRTRNALPLIPPVPTSSSPPPTTGRLHASQHYGSLSTSPDTRFQPVFGERRHYSCHRRTGFRSSCRRHTSVGRLQHPNTIRPQGLQAVSLFFSINATVS